MTDAESWMDLAIEAARAAASGGEVPVGAIVLRDGIVLGKGRNTTEEADDPSGHAEVNALRAAARVDGDWRIEGTTLVVTLAPCAMCIGAIALARVEHLIYGARDRRLGACGSILDLTTAGIAPHLRKVEGGVREAECGDLLREFFRALR